MGRKNNDIHSYKRRTGQDKKKEKKNKNGKYSQKHIRHIKNILDKNK